MDVDATGLESNPCTVKEEEITSTNTSPECRGNSSSSSNTASPPGKMAPRPPVPLKKPGVAPKPMGASTLLPSAKNSKTASAARLASGSKTAPSTLPKARPRTSLPPPPSPPSKAPPPQTKPPLGGSGGDGEGSTEVPAETPPSTLSGGEGEGGAPDGGRNVETQARTLPSAGGPSDCGTLRNGDTAGGELVPATSGDCENASGGESLSKKSLHGDGSTGTGQEEFPLAADGQSGETASTLTQGSVLDTEAPHGEASLPGDAASSTIKLRQRTPPATLPKSKPSLHCDVPKSSPSSLDGEPVTASSARSPPQILPKPRTSPSGNAELPSRGSSGEEAVLCGSGVRSPPNVLPKPRTQIRTEEGGVSTTHSEKGETSRVSTQSLACSEDGSKWETVIAEVVETTAESLGEDVKPTNPSVFPKKSSAVVAEISEEVSATKTASQGADEPVILPSVTDGDSRGQIPKPSRPSKLPPKRPNKSPSLRQTRSPRVESEETSPEAAATSPTTGAVCESAGRELGTPVVAARAHHKPERTGSLGRGTKPSVKPPAPPPSKPPPPPPPPKSLQIPSPRASGSDQTASPPVPVPQVTKPLPPLPKSPPVSPGSSSSPSQLSSVPDHSPVSPSASHCSTALPEVLASPAEPVEKFPAQVPSVPKADGSSRSGDAASVPLLPKSSKPLPPLPECRANLSPGPPVSHGLPASESLSQRDVVHSQALCDPVVVPSTSPRLSASKTASPQGPPPLPSKPPAGLLPMVGGKPVTGDKSSTDSHSTPKAPSRKPSRAKSKTKLPPPPLLPPRPLLCGMLMPQRKRRGRGRRERVGVSSL